jgi:hypothetical protein
MPGAPHLQAREDRALSHAPKGGAWPKPRRPNRAISLRATAEKQIAEEYEIEEVMRHRLVAIREDL